MNPPSTRGAQQAALDAAYASCAAIAARHGKSYHLATRLLTADRRPAVHALYAAARTADDLVDVPGDDPAADLATWSAALLDELATGWSDD
ncbi:MAG: crtB, partial [Modestobacter sp.]|nr:crtB [Modestobacter sp.]